MGATMIFSVAVIRDSFGGIKIVIIHVLSSPRVPIFCLRRKKQLLTVLFKISGFAEGWHRRIRMIGSPVGSRVNVVTRRLMKNIARRCGIKLTVLIMRVGNVHEVLVV